MTQSKNRKLPIVLANGFFPFPVSLEPVAKIYRAAGYEVHIVPFRYCDVRDTVEYARHIAAIINEITASGATQQVHLIGISMGGIAGLYAIRHLALATKVKTLITVGSPFYGSPLAILGWIIPFFFRVGRQLAIGSSFLARLRAGELPPGPQYISVGGRCDVVSPPRSTALPGARHIFWYFGHHDTVFSLNLHKAIIASLLDHES